MNNVINVLINNVDENLLQKQLTWLTSVKCHTNNDFDNKEGLINLIEYMLCKIDNDIQESKKND